MQSIELLWNDTVALFNDRVTLVGLEAQRAWHSVLKSLALAIGVAIFAIIAFIACVAAFSVWLWLAGVSILNVILIIAAVNIFGAAICYWMITKSLSAISFAASLRCISNKKVDNELRPAN